MKNISEIDTNFVVDRTHPTDLGFASMAKVLGDFIEDKKLL